MTTEEATLFNSTVGRQLRAEIAAAGSSLAAVARDMGISRSALDNYVTGKRAIPVPVAYELCALLGVDIHVVVERAQERFTAERVATTSEARSNVTDLRSRGVDPEALPHAAHPDGAEPEDHQP